MVSSGSGSGSGVGVGVGVGDEGRWMARTAAEDDFRDDGLSLRFARCCAKIPCMAKRRHRRMYTGPPLTDHLDTGGLCPVHSKC